MTAQVKLDIDATREKLAALSLGYAVDALEGLLAEVVCAEPWSLYAARLLRWDEPDLKLEEETDLRSICAVLLVWSMVPFA